MQAYRVDENGYFVEDVILEEGEETPSDCVTERPPQPCWKPRWTGTEWVEEGEPPESQPKPPTIEERLTALETLELERMFGND